MNATTEFRPSSVPSQTMLKASFGKAESELAAMCVTNLLASSDATWDTEFSYESFVQWVNGSLSVNDLYREMLRMFGGDFIIKGIQLLIDGGYITRSDRDGATYFTVTDGFVEVMRRFA